MTTVTLCERKPFDARHDVAQNIIQVEQTADLPAEKIERFVDLFNTYGFAILQCPKTEDDEGNLLELETYFGKTIKHNRANERDVLTIDSSKPVPGYLGSQPDPHLLHIDGAFLAEPERVLTLKCITKATTGGVSQLASGLAGFKFLQRECPEDLPYLMEDDAITIERDKDRFVGPIYRRVGDRIHFRFRMDTVAHIAPSDRARRAFEALCDFYMDPANYIEAELEPNQILVLDNVGILHGRTAYTGPRRLLRRNYDATGSLASQMLIGFVP